MSEFSDMLKEAFVGDEPFEADPGVEVLRESVKKFDARMRTVRYMAWFGVTFFTVVAAWTAVLLYRAPEETSLKTLLLHFAVFVWASVGIGWGKMWFSTMHNHISIQKELKRLQMWMLDNSGR